MNIFLWIIQGLLAAMFVMAGLMKSTQPKEKLVDNLPWVTDFSANTVKLIGVSQLLAALGLILPAVTGIAPILTPLAATGLAVIMVLAAIYHARKNEWSKIGVNVLIFALAVVVAWGRFGPYTF